MRSTNFKLFKGSQWDVSPGGPAALDSNESVVCQRWVLIIQTIYFRFACRTCSMPVADCRLHAYEALRLHLNRVAAARGICATARWMPAEHRMSIGYVHLKLLLTPFSIPSVTSNRLPLQMQVEDSTLWKSIDRIRNFQNNFPDNRKNLNVKIISLNNLKPLGQFYCCDETQHLFSSRVLFEARDRSPKLLLKG